MIAAVIDNRQVINHRDHAVRRIGGASAATVAADVAIIEYGVAVLEVFTGDPQAMTNGMQ